MDINQISISPLKKAADSLTLALQQKKDDFMRDAVIQRFEYTYELSWKLLKRYLEALSNQREYNVRDIFREAGKQGLIDSVENWLIYHRARNLTSHTYDEIIAEETYVAAKAFSEDVLKLISVLERKLSGTN